SSLLNNAFIRTPCGAACRTDFPIRPKPFDAWEMDGLGNPSYRPVHMRNSTRRRARFPADLVGHRRARYGICFIPYNGSWRPVPVIESLSMRRKIIIVLLVALLIITGGLAAFWPFRSRHVLRLPGVVEVQEVRLGSKIGGRVEAVLVQEGDVIYKNQPLITFEAPELRNQRD